MEKCYILAEAAIKEETLTAAPSELIDGTPVSGVNKFWALMPVVLRS